MPITITVDDRALRQLIKDTAGGQVVKLVADGVNYGIHPSGVWNFQNECASIYVTRC